MLQIISCAENPKKGESAAVTYARGPPSVRFAGTGVNAAVPSHVVRCEAEDPKEKALGRAQEVSSFAGFGKAHIREVEKEIPPGYTFVPRTMKLSLVPSFG